MMGGPGSVYGRLYALQMFEAPARTGEDETVESDVGPLARAGEEQS